MKIRSLYLHNVRCFQKPSRISFLDPVTEMPRPITILAGSNGSGKTTVLEVIEALFAYIPNPNDCPGILKEVWETGLVCMEFSLGAGELDEDQTQTSETIHHFAVGRWDLVPPGVTWRPVTLTSIRTNTLKFPDHFMDTVTLPLQRIVAAMIRGDRPLSGGTVYFPSNRRLFTELGGPIRPVSEERCWQERAGHNHAWEGSLEELWVWRNYLDLEEGNQEGEHLRPAIQRVEALLGRDRRIFIRQGRVYVTPRNGSQNPVRLEQLPSGEQQILLLLGELARYGRPNAVCMIDEPEISLHPSLQRALVHHLNRYAREEDAQFILATHSPDIVEALPTSLVLLDHLPDLDLNVSVSELNDVAA